MDYDFQNIIHHLLGGNQMLKKQIIMDTLRVDVKSKIGRLLLILALNLFILIVFFIAQSPASADGSGYYPAPENGDWIIENETNVWNEAIILNGNLSVENGGNLTFRNVTLIMNCSEDGEYRILVNESGKLYILDYDNNPITKYDRSNITANNPEFEYKFLVEDGSVFEMRNSELSECGYEWWGDDGITGLSIQTDNVIIENSSFYNNFLGIYLLYSRNSQIKYNSLFSNNFDGILLEFSNNNLITNNIISNNNMGIHLFLMNYWNQIVNNVITKNNWGILLSQSKNNQIIYNNISHNEIGIYLKDGSRDNKIINSTISESIEYDFYLKEISNITVVNTTFNKNKVFIEDEDSELIIKWYLFLKIIDKNKNPISNATIRIKDNENGTYDKNFTTDSEGFIKWVNLTEYIENDNSKEYFTPYTITGKKDNFTGKFEINIEESKEITITLREIIHWVENKTEIRINETIILNGNLIIESGGNLTFRNVTLIMNCTEDGEFGIFVEDGGKFTVLDYDENPATKYDFSNITAFNSSNEFKFLVNASAEFEMKNSELSECGYTFGDDGKGGLTLLANDSKIENSIFSNNYKSIYLLDTKNCQILNNIFFNNNQGISFKNSDGNKIKNNLMFNNQDGINLGSSKDNIFTDNNLSNNSDGFYIHSSSNNWLINNNISISNMGIYFGSSNGNTIINNHLNDCDSGFYLSSSRNNKIINSTITNSSGNDFNYWSNSDFEVINTTFNKNNINIRDGNSDLTVKWFLDVKVVDENNIPIPNARIIVKNKYGEEEFNEISGLDGILKWIICTEYIQYESFEIYYTEHKISAEKDGILINELDVNMDESKSVILQPKAYNIIVDCDDTEKSINPGEYISFKIKVTNKGTKSDFVYLEIINPSSYLAYLNSSFISLSPEEEKTVILTVVGNDNELVGESVFLTVKGTSNGEMGIQDSVNIKISINQTHSVSIDTNQTDFYLNPSEPLNLELKIQNLGNGFDTFNISINQTASKNTEYLIYNSSQKIISLENSELYYFCFMVTPTFNAPSNLISEMVFAVISTNEPNKTLSSIKISITINQIHNITLETENPIQSGLPGEYVNFPINITNKGNGKETINFELDGKNSNWGNMDVDSPFFTLESGQSKEIDLLVFMPLNSIPSDFANITISVSTEDFTFILNITANVEQKHNLVLSLEKLEKNTDPGSYVQYFIEIENNGNADDNFQLKTDLFTIPEKWIVEPLEIIQKINKGDNEIISINITPSNYAKADVIGKIVFQVFSTINCEIIFEPIQTNTKINQVYEIVLEIDETEKIINPGQNVEYYIFVKNNGNGIDTIRLEKFGTNSNWGYLEESIVVLGPGETKNISLTLSSFENAKIGEKAFISIQAVSKSGKISNLISTSTTFKIPENKEPVADFKVLFNGKPVTKIKVGELLTFDASSSFDVEGEIEEYQWNFDNGDIRYEKILKYAFSKDTKPGEHKIILKVTDSSGSSVATEIKINVQKEDEEIDNITILIILIIIIFTVFILILLVKIIKKLNIIANIESQIQKVDEKTIASLDEEKDKKVEDVKKVVKKSNDIDLWNPQINDLENKMDLNDKHNFEELGDFDEKIEKESNDVKENSKSEN